MAAFAEVQHGSDGGLSSDTRRREYELLDNHGVGSEALSTREEAIRSREMLLSCLPHTFVF